MAESDSGFSHIFFLRDCQDKNENKDKITLKLEIEPNKPIEEELLKTMREFE